MKFVVLGASAAGLTAAKILRENAPDSEVTVVSSDEHVYSRVMMHEYLSKERDLKGINFVTPTFFTDHRINWLGGKTAVRLDASAKKVLCADGTEVPYDRLLLATGAKYCIPPIQGLRDAGRVFGFRDYADAAQLDVLANAGKRCAVIGAGLVGMDVAYAMSKRGVEVTVIEMADRIMALQLDHKAAAAYQSRFENAGCRFVLSAQVQRAETGQNGLIRSLVLADGRQIDCDFAVVCAGVRPNISFLAGSGIDCARGVTVDTQMRTSYPDVFAAGDVTGLSGVWLSAMQQGTVAAKNMCGMQAVYAEPLSLRNTMNFYGLMTLSFGAGRLEDYLDGEGYSREDAGKGVYQKIFVKDKRVVFVILQGDVKSSALWQHLLANGTDLHRLLADTGKDVFSLTMADVKKP